MPYPFDHRQWVCSLYKRTLKNTRDWKHDYPEYRRYALAIREQFDAHRNDPDERRVWLFLRSVEYLLYKFKHPEPYVFPLDPKGVAHGRECRLPESFIKNGDGRGKMETLL